MAGFHMAGAHMAGVHMAGLTWPGLTCHTRYRSHRLNLFYSCLCQKSSESFSTFFYIEEYQFRGTFFVFDIF